jgi:hypothetical protein
MQYDPSRYSAPQEPPKRHLVDRWSTESRRSYVKREEQPTVVVEGRPASAAVVAAPPAAPPAPRTITDMVKDIKQCAIHQAPSAVNSARGGHVSAERPPFHCYHTDSANVLPPRPVREETYYQLVADAHQAPATLPAPVSSRSVRLSAPLGCAGCRFCHHQVACTGEGMSSAEHAEDVSLRRAALSHKRRHDNGKQKGSSAGRGPGPKRMTPHTAVQSATLSPQPTPSTAMIAELSHSWAHLRSTSLVLCAACDRVVNRACDSEEGLQRYLDAPCGGCGAAGGLMRLLAEDTHRKQTIKAPAPAELVPDQRPPSSQARPHTPMDDFADAIELLPGGVVPMEDRRTALGERIRVGRARVPSPARQAVLDALAGIKDDTARSARLQKWLQEPQSANDSDKAKLCMTWDA